LAVFALTVLLVCFPYPNRLAQHLRHWSDPNALVEPNAPELEPLFTELSQREDMAHFLQSRPQEALRTVEGFVYEKVPYEWDWNTWGTADYLPTLAEVLEKGREDCDGRAVVAASLLRRFGMRAELVTDFAHVWVKTEHGDTMGPGKRRAVVATDRGLRVDPKALLQLPKAVAFGVAVFPFGREIIIAVVLWLLLINRRSGAVWNVVALGLIVGGLVLLRFGGANYHARKWMLEWTGIAVMLVGMWLPMIAERRRRGGGVAVATMHNVATPSP